MTPVIILTCDHGGTGADAPMPGPDRGRGDHDECGFPGPADDGGIPRANCPEVPVATIAQLCGCGHLSMLPACQGHADEVIGWNGKFIGDVGSPGVLTCPMCEDSDQPHPCRVGIRILWDDMRPAVVIQELVASNG